MQVEVVLRLDERTRRRDGSRGVDHRRLRNNADLLPLLVREQTVVSPQVLKDRGDFVHRGIERPEASQQRGHHLLCGRDHRGQPKPNFYLHVPFERRNNIRRRHRDNRSKSTKQLRPPHAIGRKN